MTGTTSFPAAIDSSGFPLNINGVTDHMDEIPHDTIHNNASAALIAIETKLGIDASSDISSVDYKLARLQAIVDSLLVSNIAVAIRLPAPEFLFVGEAVAGLEFEILGGVEPFTADIENEPTGVTSAVTGRIITISGTPAAGGAPVVHIVVIDDDGKTGATDYAMDVLEQLELTGDFGG